jgi:alanyl-tRNA synthetase
LTSSLEIRETFLKYFEQNGHRRVPSSSLIPFNDPTLLFTNAGMNQFKDIFLGRERRPYTRAATSQKCMRVSGKHNDFKDVGHSRRHHTFFEMLGNFSFGDYFKKDAIHFAWELLTGRYGLDPGRLWITVFREDDEAWDLWHRQEGIPAERILRLDEADNFWTMGETGPCGPSSELHYDFGRSPLPDHGECDLTCPCGRWVEVWNLVFMQFNRDASGRMDPLPSPSIDTGMGLERITTILQGRTSNYDTDLFRPLLDELSGLCGNDYGADPGDDVSMRVIADHARAAAFVVGDGQYPGNDRRGYVLRKILRRAMVHGKRLGITDPFLYRLAGSVIEAMRPAYPELAETRETVARVIRREEESFAGTLGEGLRDFNERAARLKAAGERALPGEEAFFLYDTRGLPLEIIEDLARENGLTVDEAAFARAFETQRERSRRDYASGKIRQGVAQTLFEGTTDFVGYDAAGPVPARIRAIIVDGERAEAVSAGERGELALDATPFYAASGGQVGDTGRITRDGGRARVLDTIYRGTAITHLVEVEEGRLETGDAVTAEVDLAKRRLTMKNHTATHLLQAALRQVLGAHVKQAGSLVTPERLRFDFTHYAPLSPAEIRRVEDLVNGEIWNNSPIATSLMDLEEAMRSGATALFGEKYQEKVRVVEVPGFSRELCGGTHVPATGHIGVFKIVGEGGISAGVRRVEAVTGPAALERFRSDEELIDALQEEGRVPRQEIPALLEKLHGRVRSLERELGELKARSARSAIGDILGAGRDIRGVQVVAHAVPSTDRAGLRTLADELKQKLGSGVVVLGTPQEGKPALVVMVTADLCGKIPAGGVIKRIAPLVGGGGGGKPELAEAGGKDASRLGEALDASYGVIEEMLAGAP